MAFGNRMGVTLDASVEAKDLFAPAFGDLIAEVPADKLDGLTIDYTVIGEVTEGPEGVVRMETTLGGHRLVDWLNADPLPRIC